MDINEALESPGFWLLGGGGTAAVLLGWIMSKRMGMESLPFWQIIVIVLGVLVAAAFFSTRE